MNLADAKKVAAEATHRKQRPGQGLGKVRGRKKQIPLVESLGTPTLIQVRKERSVVVELGLMAWQREPTWRWEDDGCQREFAR